MGVPTFFKWLSVKYPKILVDAKEPQTLQGDGQFGPPDPSELLDENPNGEFDNLYLDMNGIIHPCCHPEDADSPTSEEEMFHAVFDYIDRLIGIVRPRKLLYMAIDGVAPRAKMNQQRMRRFKTASEVEDEEKTYLELKQQFESEGRPVPPPKTHWDSNVITPGTPFFDRLTTALKYYINERMSNTLVWRGLKVILSDASCPGEGEHKIMHYIRAQRTYPNYDPNQRHCLYGADADLIMLGLATHEAHFTIMREAVLDGVELRKCYLCGRTGHVASDCTGEPEKEEGASPLASAKSQKASWKPLQFLKIPILREYLEQEFSFRDTSGFHADFERCVDDFVLICFFVGNDFLPHLPSLSIHKGSIDQMILLYQKIRPLLPDYLSDAGVLNLSSLKTFVDHLGKVEEIVFQEELKRQNRVKQKRTEDEARVAVRIAERKNVPSTALIDDNFIALHELKKIQGQTKECTVETSTSTTSPLNTPQSSLEETLPPPSKRQKFSHEENIDDFKAQMKAKQKEAGEIQNPEDTIQLGIGEKKEWKFRYYQQKFHLTGDDMEKVDRFAERVAVAYAEGLNWVLRYYYQGVCSWEWYYPFHYAPFASDIVSFGLDQQKPFRFGQPFKPFEQLMAVLPARSSHCLPPILARLMKNPHSPIIDFYPHKFKEDPDGKRYRWQWVVLLPFIDQARLLETVKPLELNLTSSEKERNSEGVDRLFVSQFHSLAPQIVVVQTAQTNQECSQIVREDLSEGLHGELQLSRLGFVTGTPIETGGRFPTHTFPPRAASCVSCEFRCVAASQHICRFLPGARPPERTLKPNDFQFESSRDRRFNAGAAKRIIIGSLGRLGIVDKQTVDAFFQHPSAGANSQNTQGFYSDNRYQVEMFGPVRRKRSRSESGIQMHIPNHFHPPPSQNYCSNFEPSQDRRSYYKDRSSSSYDYATGYTTSGFHQSYSNQQQIVHHQKERPVSAYRHYDANPYDYRHEAQSSYGPCRPQSHQQHYVHNFSRDRYMQQEQRQWGSDKSPPPCSFGVPVTWTSNQLSLQHHPGRPNSIPVRPRPPPEERFCPSRGRQYTQQPQDPYEK